MSKAAVSVLVFGIYLVVLGLTLLLIPNLFLGLLGLPGTTEPWIRIVGVLLLILAYYCVQSARLEITDYFRLSVHGRLSVIIFFTGLVLFGLADPLLIAFGVLDLLGALWTAWALRTDDNATDDFSKSAQPA